MRAVVHIHRFYDWEPLPKDVGEPTEADIKALRVKPAAGGGWLMRVEKDAPDAVNGTHTSATPSEAQLIEVVIQEMTRGDRTPMTRSQMLARYLTRYVMPHNAHKKWMTRFEIHDDGPSEELFRAKIAAHVEAGNISELDVEDLVEAYMTPGDADAHVDHLHAHFGVKKAKAV